MPNNIQEFKIPTEGEPNPKAEMDPNEFQIIGDNEEGESSYINESIPNGAKLVEKSEVKNATTRYKDKKIGKTALFSINDELTA